MLLGCIGDDFTGSSDLANTLVKGGMTVTQYCGLPVAPAAPDVEAGVVALKTRSLPAGEAVRQSLAALDWLQAQGCRQIFFKYCSTFDSTPEGNIGPVAEALMQKLGAGHAVVCPAFPAAGRSLYQGHLFVGDRLLNESGMEAHPLTPMTDPDIRRWLRLQTRQAVGHVAHADVMRGAEAIAEALAREAARGAGLIVVDAVSDGDLHAIGTASVDLPLVTGGSGVALGLPENFRRAGLLTGRSWSFEGVRGPGVVLSGSCSQATRRQVEIYRRDYPALEITADAVMEGRLRIGDIVAFVLSGQPQAPLVYSSADPQTVRRAQEAYGAAALAEAIEALFADLAAALSATGIQRLVSAGGETSGAVVTGLGCSALRIGPEIDPGVPALRVEDAPLALALKSGNFGGDDFFARALAVLAGGTAAGERA
ncbi:3-oxo-tetronate kinase [Polymorphum gilvum]|uniref:3-oxo-tetronate kinase n=1 Tax=Polymorphum gilvum (strain LMG 25793 / CGMCC 1.9160 / SL003B-26A1) TaxID=991905 RepID=F2IZK5_POLGS|nr:3-oxo-tetronate kinase [Polymorphum gilvum]ADZ69562.1 Type III effector Hrp-dependent outer proteins (Hop) [Polymorphum gilvum SL003B-26A1]